MSATMVPAIPDLFGAQTSPFDDLYAFRFEWDDAGEIVRLVRGEDVYTRAE